MSSKKSRKKHFEPITIKELMKFSSRQLRARGYSKRPSAGRPKADAPYSETGKLGPNDLKRAGASQRSRSRLLAEFLGPTMISEIRVGNFDLAEGANGHSFRRSSATKTPIITMTFVGLRPIPTDSRLD